MSLLFVQSGGTSYRLNGFPADHEENPLIVMDAGIATEANLAWLKEKGWRYLVVSRKRHIEWDEEKASLIRSDGNNEVKENKRSESYGGKDGLVFAGFFLTLSYLHHRIIQIPLFRINYFALSATIGKVVEF